MIDVIMLKSTYHSTYGALPEGTPLAVDEETAERWTQNAIAEPLTDEDVMSLDDGDDIPPLPDADGTGEAPKKGAKK